MAKKKPEPHQITIQLEVPTSVESKYATSCIVQYYNDQAILCFFEVVPPRMPDSEEERRAQLEQITSIEAKVVSCIILAPYRLPELINVLTTSYESYLEKYEAIDKDEEVIEDILERRAPALVSEAVLRKYWLTPEEDEAWRDL